MPPAVSLLGISARREEKMYDHGYFMNLGTNDRWADANMESPHRLSVPFSGIGPLFIVVNLDSNPNSQERKTSQRTTHAAQTRL